MGGGGCMGISIGTWTTSPGSSTLLAHGLLVLARVLCWPMDY